MRHGGWSPPSIDCCAVSLLLDLVPSAQVSRLQASGLARPERIVVVASDHKACSPSVNQTAWHADPAASGCWLSHSKAFLLPLLAYFQCTSPACFRDSCALGIVPAQPNAEIEHHAESYQASLMDQAISWLDGALQGLSGYASHFMKGAT